MLGSACLCLPSSQLPCMVTSMENHGTRNRRPDGSGPAQVVPPPTLEQVFRDYAPRIYRSEERRVGKESRSLCDWSSDVCSSDLFSAAAGLRKPSDVRICLPLPSLQPAPVYGNEYGEPRHTKQATRRLWPGSGRSAAYSRAGLSGLRPAHLQIGRASCRERVEITV